MLLLVVALLCLAGSVYLVAEYVSLPSRERMLSFRRAAAYGRRSQKKDGSLQGSLRTRALLPAMEHAARTVLRMNPKMTVEAVQLRLLSAGLGRRVSPMAFLAAKGFAAVAGLVVRDHRLQPGEGPGDGVRAGDGARSRRLHRSGLRPQQEDPRPSGAAQPGSPGRARPPRRQRRGRPRLRRRRREDHRAGRGAARRGVRAHAQRDAHRREPSGRAEEARRPDGHPRDRRVRAGDRPGRPVRNLARPHPPRAGRRHASPAADRRRGEGDEGAR